MDHPAALKWGWPGLGLRGAELVLHLLVISEKSSGQFGCQANNLYADIFERLLGVLMGVSRVEHTTGRYEM